MFLALSHPSSYIEHWRELANVMPLPKPSNALLHTLRCSKHQACHPACMLTEATGRLGSRWAQI